jgi:hypothetical protein
LIREVGSELPDYTASRLKQRQWSYFTLFLVSQPEPERDARCKQCEPRETSAILTAFKLRFQKLHYRCNRLQWYSQCLTDTSFGSWPTSVPAAEIPRFGGKAKPDGAERGNKLRNTEH